MRYHLLLLFSAPENLVEFGFFSGDMKFIILSGPWSFVCEKTEIIKALTADRIPKYMIFTYIEFSIFEEMKFT